MMSFRLIRRRARMRQYADRAIDRFIEVPRDTRRGIRWVLAWAGAWRCSRLRPACSSSSLTCSQRSARYRFAARAGAMEATLPRATYQSVTAAVDRRLNQYPLLAKQLHVSLLQNGTLVQSQFRQHEGDRFRRHAFGPKQLGGSRLASQLDRLARRVGNSSACRTTIAWTKTCVRTRPSLNVTNSDRRGIEFRVVEHPLLQQFAKPLQVDICQLLIMSASQHFLVPHGAFRGNIENVIRVVRAQPLIAGD